MCRVKRLAVPGRLERLKFLQGLVAKIVPIDQEQDASGARVLDQAIAKTSIAVKVLPAPVAS